MCLFSAPVARVAQTRIFVAAIRGGTVQLTVYSNVAHSKTPGNAMVLPVPWGPLGVQLIDLSGYPYIFDDLDAMFPSAFKGSFSFGGFSSDSSGWQKKSVLPIARVGGYRCTIVPSIADLDRVDAGLLTMDAAFRRLLAAHYATGFGFVVCGFDDKVENHPIGFLSHVHSSGRLFVPLRHEHEHRPTAFDAHDGVFCNSCHQRPITGTRWKCAHCADYDLCSLCHMRCEQVHDPSHLYLEVRTHAGTDLPTHRPLLTDSNNNAPRPEAAGHAFDHNIYVANAKVAEFRHGVETTGASMARTGVLGWAKIRADLAGQAITSMHRVTMKGTFPNDDAWCPV